MKAKKIILLGFVTLLAVALSVSSCNFAALPPEQPQSTQPPEAVETPAEEIPAAEAPAEGAEALDEESLAEFNSRFDPLVTVDGESRINPLCCFLTSLYDSVEELDLRAFLHNFPIEAEGSVEEFEALRSSPDWPFAELASVTDMPVPLHKYPAEAVEQVLTRYSDLSLQQLRDREGGFGRGVHYLEAYDAFYNYTSDFALEAFEAFRGERQGDSVRLYQNYWDGSQRVLCLEMQGEEFKIVSYNTVEAQ